VIYKFPTQMYCDCTTEVLIRRNTLSSLNEETIRSGKVAIARFVVRRDLLYCMYQVPNKNEDPSTNHQPVRVRPEEPSGRHVPTSERIFGEVSAQGEEALRQENRDEGVACCTVVFDSVTNGILGIADAMERSIPCD